MISSEKLDSLTLETNRIIAALSIRQSAVLEFTIHYCSVILFVPGSYRSRFKIYRADRDGQLAAARSSGIGCALRYVYHLCQVI